MSSLETGQPIRGKSVRFGVFEVDLRAGEVRKHGVKIKLQEQPFQILRLLLENPGEIVTREELRQRIWPADTFVGFDHGLYNAIKRLREALGDSAENPRFIETLSRRGYRFIGQISETKDISTINAVSGSAAVVATAPAVESRAAPMRTPEARVESAPVPVAADNVLVFPVPKAPSAEPDSKPRPTAGKRWLRVAAAALVLLLVLGLSAAFYLKWNRMPLTATPPPIRSLAVLPLQNLSGDPAQEYFADGMTEELITELSQLSGLRVISRTSVMRYKKTDKSLSQIARELGVDAIVEGSVIRSGDRVRITAQLIYAAKDTNLWAQAYDRDLKDVLALQSAVAGAIAAEIKLKMTPGEQAHLKQARPVNLKAYEAYLQGAYHMGRFGNGSDDAELKIARGYYQQAIDEDPNFVQAYLDLAHTYMPFLALFPENISLVKAAAEKAVALDPDSADVHALLGHIKLFSDWDWEGAEKEIRRALELNPNSAEAHALLGGYFKVMGRFDEQLSEAQRAQELDPGNDHLSVILRGRRPDQSLELLQRFAASHPESPPDHWEFFKTYQALGMHKEAIEQLQALWVVFGFQSGSERIKQVYARSGYEAALREFARQMEQIHEQRRVNFASVIAEIYASAGDNELALRWLEVGYRERDGLMVWLQDNPDFIPLRSDPRFIDLVRRMGLPQQPRPTLEH